MLKINYLAKTSFALANFKSFRTWLHIPNMVSANKRKAMQDNLDNVEQSALERDDRVYKPTYTLELNRVGEILLYSCEPAKHMTVYYKYPYILYESLAPMCMFLYGTNPLSLPWTYEYGLLLILLTCWWPRVWWLRSLRYRIRRMS